MIFITALLGALVYIVNLVSRYHYLSCVVLHCNSYWLSCYTLQLPLALLIHFELYCSLINCLGLNKRTRYMFS